jgi:hypothetical protein
MEGKPQCLFYFPTSMLKLAAAARAVRRAYVADTNAGCRERHRGQTAAL